MLEWHKMDDTYNCPQCSHRTESAFQLAHHARRNHKNIYAAELYHAIGEPEQFPCICCEYKFYYQIELYEHCKQVHSPGTTGNNENGTFREEIERYLCGYCRNKYDSSLYLVKHHDSCGNELAGRLQQTTEEAEDMASPNLDGAGATRTVRDVGVIKLDRSTHDPSGEIYKYNCNYCSYRSKEKSTLKRHNMLTHATNEEINWFQCNHCSYRAKLRAHLKRHMLKHVTDEEIKWFQCNHCSYRAKRTSHLKRHMLRHAANEEINWFQCNQCSYRSKEKSTLKKHMLTHATNEEYNLFQCNHCSYRAKQKPYLKSHLLKHVANEEIDWFQCNHCSYRTKYSSALKRHNMAKHTANKEIIWFQCNHCSYRAERMPQLKAHVLRHASNEETK